MCRGDRLIADFVAGTDERPRLPEELEEHLTTTTDGLWVVWAYKLARHVGDQFVPLTGGSVYPFDARATCRFQRAHDAPDPRCTCGFHALSRRNLPGLPTVGSDFAVLTVALSGRVLAFEWAGGGMLWRAERQTVVRVERHSPFDWMESEEDGWPLVPVGRTSAVTAVSSLGKPEDPDGRLAAVPPVAPRDSGPIRLNLPVSAPVLPMCHDDAGWCVVTSTPEPSQMSLGRPYHERLSRLSD